MMQFAEKTENTDALDRLKAAFADPARGTILAWDDLERVMGTQRDTSRGLYVLVKFRKWLRREHRIVTFAERDVGLRTLTHAEAVREVPVYRQRRAFRQVTRGLRELATVDSGALTDHERLVLTRQQDAMRSEKRKLNAGAREVSAMLRRPEPLPRREPTHPMVTRAANA